MKNIFLKLKIGHHTFHHKFSVKVSKEILGIKRPNACQRSISA